MALEPVAQAETMAMLGPLAPQEMATCPEAVSASIMGKKKGLSRRGPLAWNFSNSVSRVSMPPTAVPMTAPILSALPALMVN